MQRLPVAARWLIWFISLAALCAVAAVRLDIREPINTDILTLLPGEHDSRALAAATERSREAFVRQLLILISGDDTPATRNAAQAAQAALQAAGLHADDSGAMVNHALAVYQAHHFALLDGEQAARLDREGPKALATDVAASLASPAGMVNAFGSDPGGYLAQFMSSLPRPYPDFLPDGPFLTAQRHGQRYYLLSVELSGSGFGAQSSALATRAVHNAEAAVHTACSACSVAATGAPLFADVARREAQHETVWLSLISTVLIMLLIAYVFRSLAPHVLGFFQLFASMLAASAAVIACYGSIQILTLVFGTTLLGIAIDYAFLYFSEYWFGGGPPPGVMQKIRPGLYMGMLTGVVAFAFLLLAGFPALTQIAIFSVTGLVEAGLVVALIFPVTLTRNPDVTAHAAIRLPQQFIQTACRASPWRHLLPALLLLGAVPGWFLLHASDDVRELQHFPSRLMRTDAHIRTTLGQIPPPGFFLIEAPDLQQALNREEELFAQINHVLPDSNTLGLSRFLPSERQQQASLKAWQHVFASPVELKSAFTDIGLPAELATHYEQDWQKASHVPLTEPQLFNAVPDLKRFVIPTDHGVALLATVIGSRDINSKVLNEVAARVPGARFVEPLSRITATFHRIRVRATWLVIIGYLLISTLLIWRYGRREAVRMLYPPLLAMGITLGALGWLGEPVNIFVVVALILILGLGRDYAVFLREGGGQQRSPALAVTMSALTTLCSFGLLSLSQIPALHAFGLATLIGILASYLSAPLSLPPVPRNPT